jgi:arylsulfatase A-like enzyme
VYGNSRGLTPFLDSLAQRAVVFHQAYAQAPWTNPSVASLFTSRFQSQHGVVSFGATVAPSEITLAEILRDQGFATGGFLANGLVSRRKGFAQGFDQYAAYWGKFPTVGAAVEKTRNATINELAEHWLEELTTDAPPPFFLYVHYIEPHSPYTPPEPFLDVAARGRARPTLELLRWRMAEQFGAGATTLDAQTLEYIQTLYDGEVASMDEGVRALHATLQRLGLLDESMIVFTSDHGEAFAEHGFMGHGQTLYNEVIRVPLLMVVPGERTRLDVDEPVALIDVAPTVLELVGCPVPPSFEGRSLRSAMARTRHPWRAAVRQWLRLDAGPRPVFSETLRPGEPNDDRVHHERAVVVGGRKLIVGTKGEKESYDLLGDPEELDVLTKNDGALVGAMGAFRSRFGRAVVDAPPIDPELRERMRALGYVE